MTTNILLAGFGGQGILFAGKQLAKMAMDTELQVSWLPSYGPEMRGGAANCSVIISDEEIGSPLVVTPDLLIAMNLPSFEKFVPAVKEGGLVLYDSSLIAAQANRSDIKAAGIPATAMASEAGLSGMANVIILGYALKLTGLFEYEAFLAHMIEGIPPAKAALIEKNKKALEMGWNFAE
ncbi:MAG: 2-oxoacid:ferredoxin oxidoreductase subunit gamma [Ruminococcaceae bacterium]|nr:2-oxoacid:ferredoxin oxidoreductase subunit gamma [Oscillospiraceae bacterium]